MFDKIRVYAEDINIVGDVVSIDFENEELTIKSDGETYKVNTKDVMVLQKIFEVDGQVLYDMDVLEGEYGDAILVSIVEGFDGASVYSLDKNLDLIEDEWDGSSLVDKEFLLDNFKVVGNYYKMTKDLADKFDFNIKIAKKFDGNLFTYFYVCNNKESEEIDLVKVVFVGSNIIEEEEYYRDTVDYNEYTKMLESGELIEVSQGELQNYALGMLHGLSAHEGDLDKCVDEDFEEDSISYNPFIGAELISKGEEAPTDKVSQDNPFSYNTCDDCKKPMGDCYCSLWD